MASYISLLDLVVGRRILAGRVERRQLEKRKKKRRANAENILKDSIIQMRLVKFYAIVDAMRLAFCLPAFPFLILPFPTFAF